MENRNLISTKQQHTSNITIRIIVPWVERFGNILWTCPDIPMRAQLTITAITPITSIASCGYKDVCGGADMSYTKEYDRYKFKNLFILTKYRSYWFNYNFIIINKMFKMKVEWAK